MSLPKKIFITGTDTGVGKTVVTAALACCLSQSGKKVSVIKPVQTGTCCQNVSDIEFVYKVLERDFDYNDHCPYSFSEPLSPKTACELENRSIDTGIIKSAINKHEELNDAVLIEGAGGLLVPVTENCNMADLARDLSASLIIVCRPFLGTISHTALTVEAARSRGLNILGIVFSNFPYVPGLSEASNPQEILRLTGVPLLGVLYDDGAIDVENGQIGSIRKSSISSFISLFGGTLE
ncbi:MAG: dethiobiotin synthase, partial [Candidatus Dadabacteria bacterium]|nr:dethiobiotin synthase [Candidatus Dadabacteria bacterium]NIS10331.1 dethiobiotin synthase [Candidatus Dadabacteria bacterium]NIY23244.1 dethiobiotin synthase [Candidatus Dadabacteria bacterium]